MGIKERKERHKEDLKQLILDTAKSLFTKYGYEATSIRKIAAEIEFSPTTIYLYYKDKSDIIYALHQEGFKLMAQKFSALVNVEHPFERLKAMGKTYMQFALENSDFYELMFIMKEPLEFLDSCGDKQAQEGWPEGYNTFNSLLMTIEDCQRAGYFKGHEPRVFALMVWSTMHGLCSLTVHGHLGHMAKSHNFFENGVEALEAAFGSFVRLLEGVK
ncbi:TetR/AcrR family transcriptional regulator [Arcticibacter tournemirensis]|uniref:TetR/AcrR family transcriptional regulator n=1 Tax=Arcticibacter tournemirensis TaxID=699437 RepID=A0A4Q0M329_9SPHI|nr:TetR/AcrR family transcriptional regulator [Arcticibacter tournemirensis]RXF67153.1 TetR/AcrR family transcriptional regulator [Arcticibacter tournemirensis]